MTPRDRTLSILAPVAADHDINVRTLLSRNGRKLHHPARQQAYLRLRSLGWSYEKIARLFQRDHSTICCAIRVRPSVRRLQETA